MVRSIIILLITGIFTIMSCASQNADFYSRTDSLLNYLYHNNRFCGTILVARNNEIIYHKTFPAQNTDSANEQYRIASITKMFTATLIYQLAEENKLTLNDKLIKYFPKIKNAESISILQMLGHQSGIPDLINNDDFSSMKSNTMSREEVVALITNYGSAFKPGEKTQYSNSNYVLLGYIIEDILQKPFDDIVHERICEPLHLSDTYMETSAAVHYRNAGYQFNGSQWIPATSETNATISAAAGAMISTPADLQIFLQALFDEKLINRSHLDSMCTLSNSTYGRGIFYTPFDKHAGYGHTGHIDEFRSAATYFMEDSTCLIFCFNGLNYPMNDIAIGIMSYYFNADYHFPEAGRIMISEQELKKYEGIYRLKLFRIIPVTKVKIISENGVLATATVKDFDTDKTIAEPIATDVFKNYQYRSTLSFIYNKKEKIKGCFFKAG